MTEIVIILMRKIGNGIAPMVFLVFSYRPTQTIFRAKPTKYDCCPPSL